MQDVGKWEWAWQASMHAVVKRTNIELECCFSNFSVELTNPPGPHKWIMSLTSRASSELAMGSMAPCIVTRPLLPLSSNYIEGGGKPGGGANAVMNNNEGENHLSKDRHGCGRL